MPEVKISLTGEGKKRHVILMYSFEKTPQKDPSSYTLKQIGENHYILAFDHNVPRLKPQRFNGKIWYQRSGYHLLEMFKHLDNFGKTIMIEKNNCYSLPESLNDPRLFNNSPAIKRPKLPDQTVIYPTPTSINTIEVQSAIDEINNLVDEFNGDLELSIENGKLTAALIIKII